MKTSITTTPYFVFPRVFWLKSMRSACSWSFGLSAAVAPAPAAHVGLQRLEGQACVTSRCAASQVGTASRTLKSSARSLSASMFTCSSAPLRLPGVQPGLEALAHPPQHAGEVRRRRRPSRARCWPTGRARTRTCSPPTKSHLGAGGVPLSRRPGHGDGLEHRHRTIAQVDGAARECAAHQPGEPRGPRSHGVRPEPQAASSGF